MTNEEYKNLVKKYIPKENKKKKYLISFIIGGLMGVIAEILTILYTNVFNLSHNESTSFMMITIIIITCILTGLGVFDELIKKAGAGLFIPITGFAHATASSTLDYKKDDTPRNRLEETQKIKNDLLPRKELGLGSYIYLTKDKKIIGDNQISWKDDNE